MKGDDKGGSFPHNCVHGEHTGQHHLSWPSGRNVSHIYSTVFFFPITTLLGGCFVVWAGLARGPQRRTSAAITLKDSHSYVKMQKTEMNVCNELSVLPIIYKHLMQTFSFTFCRDAPPKSENNICVSKYSEGTHK